MKRGGFKRPTYNEAMAKLKEKQQRALQRRKTKARQKKPRQKPKPKAVKYPTIHGVKSTRRWVGAKGTLWAIFSMYVRKRDFIKYGGRCISCPRILEDWRGNDAGHYISVTRGNNLTLFHEKNVNLQCKKCNNPTMTPDASIPYRHELERRWGEGTADELWGLLNQHSQAMTQLETYREIERYKKMFDGLD